MQTETEVRVRRRVRSRENEGDSLGEVEDDEKGEPVRSLR